MSFNNKKNLKPKYVKTILPVNEREYKEKLEKFKELNTKSDKYGGNIVNFISELIQLLNSSLVGINKDGIVSKYTELLNHTDIIVDNQNNEENKEIKEKMLSVSIKIEKYKTMLKDAYKLFMQSYIAQMKNKKLTELN